MVSFQTKSQTKFSAHHINSISMFLLILITRLPKENQNSLTPLFQKMQLVNRIHTRTALLASTTQK